MLVVGLVISSLTVRIRDQAEAARQREQRTAALYAMSRELASTRGRGRAAGDRRAPHQRSLPEPGRRPACPTPTAGSPPGAAAAPVRDGRHELAWRQWVYEHRAAGRPGHRDAARRARPSTCRCSPRADGGRARRPARRPPCPGRARAAPPARDLRQPDRARHRAGAPRRGGPAKPRSTWRRERLRNSLLSSVSHDLRTPLAAITGRRAAPFWTTARGWMPRHASELLDPPGGGRAPEPARPEPPGDDAARVGRARASQGVASAGGGHRRGAAAAWASGSADRPVTTRVPPDLPLVAIDDVLIGQVLVNLLDNAVKYTPPGSPIRSCATATDHAVTVEVADRGPGLPPGEEDRVFEKFYRGAAPPPARRRARPGDLPGHRQGPRRANLGPEPPRGRRGVPLPLPIAEAPPAAVPAECLSPSIVLIEDEPQIRRFLRATLTSQGYRAVRGRRTGADGLVEAAHPPARRRHRRPRPARHRRPRGDPPAARVVRRADHRAVGARPGARQGRRARRRRRRLRQQAVRRRRAAGPHPRRPAPPAGASREGGEASVQGRRPQVDLVRRHVVAGRRARCT